MIEMSYAEGGRDLYQIPLTIVEGDGPRQNALAQTRSSRGSGVLRDATDELPFQVWMLDAFARRAVAKAGRSSILFEPSHRFAELRGNDELQPVLAGGEQSNTSIRYGRRLMLKLYRRIESGQNPDAELNEFLSEQAGFAGVPQFAGRICYRDEAGNTATAGILQQFVENQGNGWEWTLDELGRYYERCLALPFHSELESVLTTSLMNLAGQEIPDAVREVIGLSLELTATLAKRTAEMHLALASAQGEETLRPEPLTREDLVRIGERLHVYAGRVFDTLKGNLADLPDEVVEAAGLVLSRRRSLLSAFRGLDDLNGAGMKIRIHGDYHLGQVLRVQHDYSILDFEGEPSRTLAERRSKQPALKDVAGMLRSFSYAAWSAYLTYVSRRPQDSATLESWARLWEKANSAMFLRTYREALGDAPLVPADGGSFERLLNALMLEKALYELEYELNNRPSWVRVPLMGLLSL
jgi:maltose alpha-D-glucosyltransferase/alpha-amylase